MARCPPCSPGCLAPPLPQAPVANNRGNCLVTSRSSGPGCQQCPEGQGGLDRRPCCWLTEGSQVPHRLPDPRPPALPRANQLPQDLHPTLALPGDPAGSLRLRLLRQIPAPAGAAGGPRGLHCSPDGLLYLTAGAAPCVHVLDLEGRAVCRLPCSMPGAGAFVPEDVAVTASGLVVVSDLVHGAVHALQHTARAPQGRWVTVGTFQAPRGLAVDALGRVLVTDYVAGAVHMFTLGPGLEPRGLASVLGLEGPCWVGPGPDGGLAVSEECGDVQLFGSAGQSLGSLGRPRGHTFSCPAGVSTDAAGGIVVADKQRRRVTLFPRAGPPVCLVSQGLRRPLGVACAPQGRLVVADAGDGYIKLFQYHLGLA